jgi:hypothetical protein
MTSILKFEVGRARRGGVYCSPLDVTFPALFRVVQSLSREQLDEHGLTDMEPINRYIHHTMRDEDERRIPGTIESKAIIGVPDSGEPSLVLRWHPNEEYAAAYLDAVADLSDDESNGEICRTNDGLFTRAKRSTNPESRRRWASLRDGADTCLMGSRATASGNHTFGGRVQPLAFMGF